MSENVTTVFYQSILELVLAGITRKCFIGW